MIIRRRLKITLLTLAACALLTGPTAFQPATAQQSNPAAAPSIEERGKFKLYKYQFPVGEETYEISRAGGTVQLAARSELTFVGGKVSLTASLRARPDLTPVRFEIKGQTSTRSDIDVSVEVNSDVARVRRKYEVGTMNDELKTNCFHFIVPRSSFRVLLCVLCVSVVSAETDTQLKFALKSDRPRISPGG